MVADDLTAGREVVVTGDFNDFSGEEADRDVKGNVRTSAISFKPFNLGQEVGSRGRTAHGTGAD